MVAACPVMFRKNAFERWSVGLLVDFSATGLLMNCSQPLEIGTKIIAQLERGRNRTLPALSGTGIVTRCTKTGGAKYEIACKMIHIDPPNRSE